MRAHMWFNLAAAQGDHDAIAHRAHIARLMKPSEIERAQKLAREWKKVEQ